jgi:hypothetical protein
MREREKDRSEEDEGKRRGRINQMILSFCEYPLLYSLLIDILFFVSSPFSILFYMYILLITSFFFFPSVLHTVGPFQLSFLFYFIWFFACRFRSGHNIQPLFLLSFDGVRGRKKKQKKKRTRKTKKRERKIHGQEGQQQRKKKNKEKGVSIKKVYLFFFFSICLVYSFLFPPLFVFPSHCQFVW